MNDCPNCGCELDDNNCDPGGAFHQCEVEEISVEEALFEVECIKFYYVFERFKRINSGETSISPIQKRFI